MPSQGRGLVLASWICHICESNGQEKRWAAFVRELTAIFPGAQVVSVCYEGHRSTPGYTIVPGATSNGYKGKVRARYRALIQRRPSGPLAPRAENLFIQALEQVCARHAEVCVVALSLTAYELVTRRFPPELVVYDSLLREGHALQREVPSKPLLRRPVLALEARIVERQEVQAARSSLAVSVTNAADRDWFERATGRADIVVVPNGVDLSDVIERQHVDRSTVLYTGDVTYGPNEQAVRDIRDHLLSRNPSLRLRVTGREPSGQLAHKLRHSQIEFTGFVDDLAALYKTCLALVAPLRIGGGTRLKILDALSRGIPVVATQEATVGLGLTPGIHYLEICDLRDLPIHVARLAEDRALENRLILAAHSHVRQFVWPVSIRPLAVRLKELGVS